MQAKKISEHELVRICIEELCLKEGFGEPGNLVQRDLQFLCERISAKTGVLISLSTMRRLLNGQFSRVPQIATLDAIAITSGYQNWQSFKLANTAGNGISGKAVLPRAGIYTTVTGKQYKYKNAKFIFSAGGLIFATLVFWVLMKTSKPGLKNTDKAQFSAVKVTGNDIPNTVVFRYNVDSVTADSFFIQQSWDRNRRVKISRNAHTLTDIYYEPGYHTAKLIANDKIIKTVPVSIPTDRWVFYAKDNLPKSAPKYILSTTGIKDGSLQLTKNDILNSKIDIQKQNQFLQVYFPSKIESSSDNFVLRFKIKVNELSNEPCPYFMTEIFCQNYFMYFNSTLRGCTSELGNQFGEKFMGGKTNDLSMMGTDVRSWQNVELRVINKKASIRINNVEVFSTTYNKSCGLITGLGFISNGLCQVDFVDLKTTDGKSIYSDNFER